jgi:hypothetical protein
MNELWERSAFAANPTAINLELAQHYIKRIFVQVAWGTNPVGIGSAWLAKARALGFELYAWAWCDGKDIEGEARIHAACARGYSAFCANMEEAYDAHGDASSPKMGMPSRYLAALDWTLPLAVTTTPRFASHLGEWAKRGACYQPQAFPLETKVGLTETVEFARFTLGYPYALIRPLIQSYPTNGQRPDPEAFNAEAELLGVGGIPYTIEQCLDPEGQAWLQRMRPTVERPQPRIELKPNGGEALMAKIGTSHGITAFVDWLQKQPGVPVDPGPKYNPADPATWPWPERLERTLNMLREDHDKRN